MDQTTSITSKSKGISPIWIALIATLAAIGATEIVGVNRITQTLIHRDFGAYQLAFFCFLWVFTTLFLRRSERTGRGSVVSFMTIGLCAGLLSGWLAFPFLALFHGQNPPLLRGLFSWRGISDFIVVTTVVTFGWLVGLTSGLTSFALTGRLLKGTEPEN